jgi:hypothetical protein
MYIVVVTDFNLILFQFNAMPCVCVFVRRSIINKNKTMLMIILYTVDIV